MKYILPEGAHLAMETKTSNEFHTVLFALSQKDYSPRTFKALQNDLTVFLTWYETTNCEAFLFTRVLPRDIIDFRTYCQRENLSPATINRRLAHLRVFFSVAVEKKIIDQSPAKNVKRLPEQKLAPKGLTDPEARRLMKEVELMGNLRDLCIMELMISAGLRASEVVKVEIEHLNITERKGELLIPHAKGNKTRTIPLSTRVRKVLENFLLSTEISSGHIFHGQRGLLTTLAVNKIVQKYSHRAQIKCSPHTLRHTFAYRYLKANTGDIVGLAQILGHSNINTTAIYTQHRMADLQQRVDDL